MARSPMSMHMPFHYQTHPSPSIVCPIRFYMRLTIVSSLCNRNWPIFNIRVFIIKCISELNYLVKFTYIDTSYEPQLVSYGEMFSWQGDLFPKRANQHDEVAARQKRSAIESVKSFTPDPYTKVTAMPEDGVLIMVENTTILDDYLYGSPRKPFHQNRRLFVIAIVKPVEQDFCKRVKKLLKHLWQDYAVADVILITPCNSDPEVANRLV